MPEKLHDKGYKRILSKKKNFLSLLKTFVDASWVEGISEDDLEHIDTEFILKDFKNKEADVIYRLRHNDTDVIFYCLLELQSSVDFTIPIRLLIYMTELLKRIFLDEDQLDREKAGFRLPCVVPVLLYNGADEWTAVKSFKEYTDGGELFGEHLIDFKYILINVNKYSDESLIQIRSLLSSVFLLDKKQTQDDFTRNIDIAYKIYTTLSGDEQIDLLDWLRDVLLRKPKFPKQLADKTVKDFEKGEVSNMTYAIERLFDEIEEKALEKGRDAGRQEGIKEGMKEGIKKGREQGIKEGMQEGMSIIIKNLKLKNMSDELISEYTGLSLVEIKKISSSKKSSH